MASNLNSKDYYQILGVPRGCSEAALKKAYKKLAVKVSQRGIQTTLSSSAKMPAPGFLRDHSTKI